MWSYLIIVGHKFCAIGVLFRIPFPVIMDSNIFPTFSSPRFRVQWLRLKSKYVGVEICADLWYGSIHSTAFSHPGCPLPFVEMLSFFQCALFVSLSNQVVIGLWIISMISDSSWF